MSELSPPGVAKVVKKSAAVVAEEAVEVAGKQAAKKIDFVDTDGEMIGQNGPTYTSVIHDRTDSNDVNTDMLNKNKDKAWVPDSQVKTETLLPGYQLEMVVNKGQLEAIKKGESMIGGWASKEVLPDDIQGARDVTSIKKEWKNEETQGDLYKIKFDVVEPITVKSGTAGEMYDSMLDRMLPGGIEKASLGNTKEELNGAFNKLKISGDEKKLENKIDN